MRSASTLRLTAASALLWVASGGCSGSSCGCGAACGLISPEVELVCAWMVDDCAATSSGRSGGANCPQNIENGCDFPDQAVPLDHLTRCFAGITCGADAAARDSEFLSAATQCMAKSGLSTSCASALANLTAALGPCTPGATDPCAPFGLLCAQNTLDGTFNCHVPFGATCDPKGPDPCLQFDLICAGSGASASCQFPSGAACDPGGPDPCLSFGLVCAQGSGAPPSCQTPTHAFDPCQPSVGCGYPFDCTKVLGSPFGLDGGSFACLSPNCLQTSDCPEIDTTCDKISYTCASTNDCGFGGDAGSYFGPCDSRGDGGAGQCLPFASGGFCFETGGAGIGDSCYPIRSDAGPLCAAGGYCLSGATTALCAQLCTQPGADAGALPCPSDNNCLTPPGLGAGWGICVAGCPSGGCPSGQTCTALPGVDELVCLPS